MVLNVKFLLAASLMLLSSSSFAINNEYYQKKYHTITEVNIQEVSRDVLDQEQLFTLYNKGVNVDAFPVLGNPSPIDPGQVIKVAKDLVALGEDIYRLVVKGKPSNTTSYAPISVIPKINGQPVDLLETELWKMPVKRTYQITYRNLYRMDVVVFRYSVIFSYGGTYNGKGAYLTAVQIVPESVSTMFGFDFTATMKLGGIQNNGTRENPIAAATILIEHTVSNIIHAENKTDTFFLTGRGGFKLL